MLLRNFDDTKTVLGRFDVRVICEIPIYGVSQKKFYDYWDKKTEEFTKMCLEHSPDRNDIDDCRSVFTRGVAWKYNQIVGFIRVSVGYSDVNFEEFYSFKRYRCNSKAKHYIEFNNDFHFYIGNMKTNEDIVSAIKEYMTLQIGDFRKRHPKFYVDTCAFDNIINHLDILGIIDNINGGTRS